MEWIENQITKWATHYGRPNVNRADVKFQIQELTGFYQCELNSETIQFAVHEIVQFEIAGEE